MRPYLYLMFASGGDLCGLELADDAEDTAAVRRARGLLRPACDVQRVEIWRDGRMTTSLGLN